jgi:hypothetical protein
MFKVEFKEWFKMKYGMEVEKAIDMLF